MDLPRKIIALAAWAALALAVGMLVNGARLATRQSIAREAGPGRLPAQSEFIRRIYAQPVGNDADSIDRATRVLDLAGQHDLAMRLTDFFAYCNIERLRGQDDACTRESVRSAVDRNDVPASDAEWPVDGNLASDLEHALSFSLATEQQMRDGIQSPGFWEYHRYDGPGVLTYDNPTHGALIFLAVRNRSRWEVARFKARLELQGDNAGPMELRCDQNPFPFFWLHPFTPGTEVLRVCRAPDSVKLPDLLAAVRRLQHSDSLPIRLDEFELKQPYVRVSIEDDGTTHPITLHPVRDFTAEFIPNTGTAASRLPQELSNVSCQELATCLPAGEAASLALYNFFQRNTLALPVLAGVLMGIGIGGLIRRSLRTGGIIVGVVVVGAIAIIAVSFQSSAMLAFGLTVIALGAVPLWFAGFFLGILLTRPLHQTEPGRT